MGLEERKPSWWRSVERSGRSYLSWSVYQLLLFQPLMTRCQRLLLKALTKYSNKGLFLPSVFISSSSSTLFRRGEMSQSESRCTVMQQLHQRYFLCPFVLLLFKKRSIILCAASVLRRLNNQKSLWDVNERHFTAQHTTNSLWSMCTAVQRLTANGVSQACWEHDGGPYLPAGGLA